MVERGKGVVAVRTTYDDWDLWEREVLPTATRGTLALKAAIGFVVVAILLAIVGPVALAFRAGDERVARVSSPPTTSPLQVPTSVAGSPAPAPAPAATARTAPPLPSRFVATTTDGQLVASTGGAKVSADIGGRAPRVALQPGGRSAVVERSDAQGHSDLQWWDVTGQPIANGALFAPTGRYPAFSPDGRLLAYTAGEPVTSALVVVDLASGTERRWQFPDNHELQSPTMSADGRWVALTDVVRMEARTVVFDTNRAEGPVPDPGSIGGPYRAPAFRGARGTLVAAGGLAPSGFNIVDIDPVTGASRVVYTTPFAVKAIHPDASGEHVLFVTEKAGLYVWSNGSVYQVLDGVLDAAW